MPTITFNALPAICNQADRINLATYTNPNNGTFSGEGIEDNTYFNPQNLEADKSYTITYSIIQNECEVKDSQAIEVKSMPEISFTLQGEICSGASIDLLATAEPKNGTFSTNGTTISNSFSAPEAGLYPITYTVEKNNCVDSVTKEINVIDQAEVPITIDDTYCSTDTEITPSAPAEISGKFYYNNSEFTTLYPKNLQAGINTITFKPTAENSCYKETQVSFTVVETPAPTLSDTSIIVNSPDNTIIVANPIGTITWYNENDEIIGAGSSFTHDKNEQEGTWKFCATQTDNGCESERACMNLYVTNCATRIPELEKSTIKLCQGSTIIPFNASGSGSITWYNSSDTSIVHTGESYTPTVSTEQATTYRWLVSNTDDCESSLIPVTLEIMQNPKITVTHSKNSYCKYDTPDNIAVEADIIGGTFTMSGEGVTNNQIIPTEVEAYNQALDIKILYTLANNCKDSTTYTLQIEDIEKPTTTTSISVLFNEPPTVLEATPTDAHTIAWYAACNNSAPLAELALFETQLNDVADTIFYVRQISPNGCKSECEEVHVERTACPVEKPTIVTNYIEVCEYDTTSVLFATVEQNAIRWYDSKHNLVHEGSEFMPSNLSVGRHVWTVTQTDACTSPADTAVLIVHSVPTASITFYDTLCHTNELYTPQATPTGGSFNLMAETITTINPHIYNAGKYDLKYIYTDKSTGCKNLNDKPHSFEIIAVEKPTIHDVTKLMTDADMNLSVENAQGTIHWYSNALSETIIATGNTLTHSPIEVGSWEYCATDTYKSCTSTRTCVNFVIIDCPIPAPTSEKNNYTVCDTDDMPTLQVSGEQGNTIRWYDSNNMVHTGTNYTPNNDGRKSYKYYVTQYDGSCEGKGIFIEITINSTVKPNITKGAEVCQGTPYSLQVTNSAGTVYWYNELPTPVSQPIATGTVYTTGNQTPAGGHTVWAQQNDGCTSEATELTFTIKESPEAPTISSQDVCFGSIAEFNVAPSDATIKWYSSETATTPVQSGHTYTKSGTQQTVEVFATATKNNCESAKSSKVINVHVVPEPPFVQSKSICDYEQIPTLQVSALAQAKVNWYADKNTTLVVAQGMEYVPTNNTSATYYVTQTVNNCTSKPSELKFTVHTRPNQVTFRTSQQYQICAGTQFTLETNQTNNIQWYDNYGGSSPISSGRYFNSTANNADTYTYFATQTDKNGCESDKNGIDVIVVAAPLAPVIIANPKVCEGYDAEPIIAESDDPTETITWLSKSGEILHNGNSYTPTKAYTDQAGLYTFYVRATKSGCPVEASPRTQILYEVVPTPLVPRLRDSVFCTSGGEVELYARGANVKWYDAEMHLLPHCAGRESCILNDYSEGTYNFYLSQDNGKCESEPKKVTVVLSIPPQPEIIGKEKVCSNSTEIYAVKDYNSTNSYRWKVSKPHMIYEVAQVRNDYTRSVDWYGESIDTIQVVEINKYGCSGENTLEVMVADAPTIDFEAEQYDENGFTHIINLSEPQSIETPWDNIHVSTDYYWNYYSAADSAFLDNSPTFTHSFYHGTHNITLEAINEAGCKSILSKKYEVEMKYAFYIPNSFAPTNAARGVRTFKPKGYNLATFQIEIFDSWGNLVYFSEGVDEKGSPIAEWDGTYNGLLLQSGTYMWKIQAKFVDGKKWKQPNGLFGKSNYGSVNLIR